MAALILVSFALSPVKQVKERNTILHYFLIPELRTCLAMVETADTLTNLQTNGLISVGQSLRRLIIEASFVRKQVHTIYPYAANMS